MNIAGTMARGVLASLVLLLVTAAPARSDDLKTESGFFRGVIGGRTVRLEGIVVKRADAVSRLPIAIFNSGRPGTFLEASDSKILPVWLRPVLADLARRGWLTVSVQRRGFGLSDGPLQSADGCKPGGWMHMLNADADDVQATLEFIGRRPDADPTRMISIGISAGGGASVMLSARNPPGLVAAIDMSGAEHFENCPQMNPSVVADFADMGKRSRVPNLWLFAKNDSLHPPEQVEKIRAAFTAGGGDVKLVQFDPLGSEGHTMYETQAGRRLWLPALDEFLREHGLPTWKEDDVNVLATRLGLRTPLSQANIDYLKRYLGSPSERAMARSTASNYMVTGFGSTVETARVQALKECEAKAPPCVIVMENDRWVAT
jgi:pimeloyl-ACP methyl ester carboxylesterase